MSRNTRTVSSARLIFGFVGATTLPALVIATPFLLAGQWYSAFLMLTFGLGITVPPAVVVALPMYWWLSRSGRPSVYWAALAGGVAGAAFGLVGAIRRIWLFGSNKTIGEIGYEIFALEEPHVFILIGAFCGLVGWLIAFGPRITPSAAEAPKA